MNNVLLWVGGLLVAVLALLFAVPHAVDWNTYRGVFEEEASRLLGRDVRVGGRVDLRLLPKPYVRFEKIRIADLGAMQGESFFRAESVTMWLSIPPLLRGAIEAQDVELDRPTLSLAIDQNGMGNWRTLRISPGALPFVPSDVALQAVRIRDGAITFRDIAARSSMSLSGIDGELAAPNLNGPFRFRGDLVSGGQRHEIRLNTAAMEPDGKLRLKATARTLETHNSFAIDATLAELSARPHIDGTLTAKLPLAPVALGGPARASAQVVFELQSQLALDSRGARLTDLTLGFEQDGRPQLLTGAVATTWGESRTTTVELASKWLDLDRIADASGRPLDAVRQFASRLATLMPLEGTSKASITVDQVNLGGDAVSDVRLALLRRNGVLELDDLSGLVPGNGRLAVQGRFAASDGRAPAPFDGALTLRGASLQRFMVWAFPGQSILAPGKAEAPFALAGGLVLAGDRIGLTSASLELPSLRLTGGVEHGAGDLPELSVMLAGEAIDLSLLAPELFRLDGWHRVLDSDTRAADSSAGVIERKASSGVLKLDVRAGRLTDGATVLHDVTAVITAGRGRLDIPVLRLRSAEGLALDATAQIDNTGGRRHGTVAGWAAAPTAQAATQLSRQLTALLPAAGLALSADKVSLLAPLDLGFTAQFSKGPASRVTVKADGSAAGSRIQGLGTLDGGIAGWRKAPIEITAEVSSADIAGFMARLHGRKDNVKSGDAATPGTARIKLAGASAESIAVLADVDSAAVKTSFQGRVRVPEGATSADLHGELELDTPDAAAALAVIEPDFPIRLRGMAAKGVLGIARAGNVVRLMPRDLDVGGARLAGEVSLTVDGATSRVAGRLALQRGALADLISAALDQRGDGRPADGAESALWPDAPFDFSGLDGVEGKVRLAFGALDIGDGLVLSDADLDVELRPGRIEVSRLEGRALDGAFTGRASLEKVAGGAALKLAGKLGPVALAGAIGPVAGAPAAGTATLQFEVQGRAASPRGLVTALAGTGTAEFAGARIPALLPAAVDKVTNQLVDSTAQPSRSDLATAVRHALVGTLLDAGNKRLTFEVSEGAVRIAPFEIAAGGGRAANTTTVELLTLKADSEWTLTSARRTGKSGELPAVSLVYVGPLKDVLRSEPRISVEALERELVVRRMERDVERLEQLRRQDEERALREREGSPNGAAGYGNGSAPVIEAPFPIPSSKSSSPEPRPGGTPAPAAKSSPPARTEARPRSLEDILQAR